MLNMTPTILKNFVTGKATRLYPIERRDPFPEVRGELKFDVEKCSFCVRCQMNCPSQCITVNRKEATWECDSFACVFCGICSEVCPDGALHHSEAYRPVAREKGTMFYKGALKPKVKKEQPAAATKPADTVKEGEKEEAKAD